MVPCAQLKDVREAGGLQHVGERRGRLNRLVDLNSYLLSRKLTLISNEMHQLGATLYEYEQVLVSRISVLMYKVS